MSKFKVGDKVKAVDDTKWWQRGDVGVIVPNPDGGFRVALKGGETWWFCNDEESWFELVGISGDSVTIYPNPPHKHQIEIIAWANGAEIELYNGTDDVWHAIRNPLWIDPLEYRIKPTKTPPQLKIEELEAKLVKLKGQL